MVWLAAAVCGTVLAERFSKRQKALEELLSFFHLIKLEVTHYLLPFSEAIVKISDSSAIRSLSFISECAEKLQSGEDFPTAWEKSLEQKPPCIGKDELKLLLRFGRTACSCDINGVEEILGYYGERFSSALSEAVCAKNKYARLCMFSGVFAGVIIFIILI